MARLLLVLAAILQALSYSNAFAPSTPLVTVRSSKQTFSTFYSTDGDDNAQESAPKKMSLEDKMKLWEASEEEIRAASLGGVVPGRTDAFDVGLYIAFPLMVVSGLFFAAFPFIMDSIDTSSVGPPPTV